MDINSPTDPQVEALRVANADAHPLLVAAKIQNLNAERAEQAVSVFFEEYHYLQVGDAFFAGCRRCGGTGHYSHNGDHSRCYLCDNNASAKLGAFIGDEAAAAKHAHGRAVAKARREAKAEAARMVEVRRMEAKQQALKASSPDVFEFLMAIDLGPVYTDFASYEEYEAATYSWTTTEKNSFLRAMAESIRMVVEAKKPFTENMVAAVRKMMAAKASREAEAQAAPPVEAGKQLVTGEILSVKQVDTQYGTTTKILVKDDRGFKVYGTLPKSINDEFFGAWSLIQHNQEDASFWDSIKGQRIQFSATLEQSRDDKSFGFFSRPTKGVVL